MIAQTPESDLNTRISACKICTDRFAATATAHAPRPVAWFRPGARVLIAGQAPGMRVHKSGKPFDDPSGDRLRDWLDLMPAEFYDRSRVAIVPMAFCFPGYDARGADLTPPPICAQTWHHEVMQMLGQMPLTLLVGGHAHRWHMGVRTNVTETVAGWRNTGWLKKNPWFMQELLPALRARVQEVLA